MEENNEQLINVTPEEATEKKPLEVASLVLGILSIPCALFAILGWGLSIAGLIVSLVKFKRSNAIPGLVLSIIGMLASLASSILGVLLANSILSSIA